MFYLKKKVTNKAKVEGSIYEAYLIDEITSFASYYFGDDVLTIWNRVPRNDNSGLKSLDGQLSIFSYSGKKLSRRSYRRQLSHAQMKIAHNYICFNCEELKQLFRVSMNFFLYFIS
jgi:ribosomal protein L32